MLDYGADRVKMITEKTAKTNRIAENSVFLMGGRLYHGAASLVALGLVARYLKVARFGEYGFVLAVCTIFMVLTDMGVHRIGIREISKDRSRANEIFWASSLVKCILSLITFGCIALTINVLTDEKEVIAAAYVCAFAVIFNFLGDIFSTVFIAFERMAYMTLMAVVQASIYLLFVFLFIKLDFGLKGIFLSLLLSYLARIFTGLIITCKKFFVPRPVMSRSLCYYLLKEGLPIGVNRVLRKGSFRIDTILIKMMRSASEVGLFHGPYRIIVVLNLIPQSITEALFPVFSRIANGSKEAFRLALEKSSKLLLIMAIPLTLTLGLFSERILRKALGVDFVQAAPALMVLSGVWGLMFFGELFVKAMYAYGRQSLAMRAMALCLAVNVLLDILLIKEFGYFGAVIATLFAEASLVATAYWFLTKDVGGISWVKVLPKPLLAGIFMYMAIYFLKPVSFMLAAFGGFSVFLVGLWMLRAFGPEEIEMLEEIFSKMRYKISRLNGRQVAKGGYRQEIIPRRISQEGQKP